MDTEYQYKIVSGKENGPFTIELNKWGVQGWRVINYSSSVSGLVALMELGRSVVMSQHKD